MPVSASGAGIRTRCRHLELRANEHIFECLDFVMAALPNKLLRHAQFPGALLYEAGAATGNDSRLQARAMKQHDAMPVAHVESLLLVAVLQEHDPAVGHHAVAVHQEQLDALRACIDVGGFLFHDAFPLTTKCLTE